MKKCPHCGAEYTDKSQYCLECGTLLEPVPEPPRKNLLEHLRYGGKIARKRPSVFLPSILITVALMVIAVGLALSLGLGYSAFEDPSMYDPETIAGELALNVMVFFIGILYLGIIYEPFQQHVYYAAVTNEEINIWNSFKYANHRIVSFLGAYLLGLVVAFPILIFWMSKLPYDVLMNFEEIPNEVLLSFGWPLLFFMPVGLVYEMAISIMAWENTGIFNALKVSLDFLRSSYVSIGGIFVVRILLSLVTTRVPFGGILSWLVSILLYLTLIDVYRKYVEQEEDESNEMTTSDDLV
jgi:hypothetical protein